MTKQAGAAAGAKTGSLFCDSSAGRDVDVGAFLKLSTSV